MHRKFPYPILRRLFQSICSERHFEELEGDLEESFLVNEKKYGRVTAKRMLLRDLISMLRPSVIKKIKLKLNSSNRPMFNNYIKISARNFAKEKFFSTLNVVGLAIGISACLILMQYVQHESSFDLFHPEADNIYRIAVDQRNSNTGALEFQNAQSFYAIHPSIKEEIPEIAECAQLFNAIGVFTLDDEPFREDKIFFTYSTFFDVFSFPLQSGNPKDLDNTNSIFISRSMAEKYFDQNDPIGQKISFNSGLNTSFELEVRGVYYDFPDNSHIKANALISMTSFQNAVNEAQLFGPQLRLEDVKWRWMQFYTYIRTRPGTDRALLEIKVSEFGQRHRKVYDEQQGRDSKLVLQPITTIHLDSNRAAEMETPGNRRLTMFLLAVGLLILFIAWVNYVNLATAKAINRGKEVGVRKVIGAKQSQLKTQFLLESFLLNLVAIVVAIGICYLASPFLQKMTGKDLWLNTSENYVNFTRIIVVILFGSLLAGLYPAFVMSSFKPIAVLKGKITKSKSGIYLRRGLVVFQFCVAVLLMSGIYAVMKQLDFMINHETGIDISNTVVVQSPPLAPGQTDSFEKIETFKDELMNLAEVQDVTVSTYIPGPENFWKETCYIAGNSSKSLLLSRAGVDENYLSFFDIGLIAGQGFNSRLKGAAQRVVVNERLVQDFGLNSNEEIIGKSIELAGGRQMEVIGVVEDYYHRGIRFPIEPLMLHLDSAANGQFIAVRVNNDDVTNIRKLYQRTFVGSLFEMTYLEQTFKSIYQEDTRFRSIVSLFTLVAIVIACLGLLGLSSYMLSQRLKEISIRKVLGAKVVELFRLLVSEYILLSVIGALISMPIAYYLIDGWLSSYTSRIQISPLIFIIPVLVIVPLILLTIGYQTLKTTLVNPTECLKNE